MTLETFTDTTELDILPAAQPMQPGAIGQLMAHAQAMATAKQFADAICDTDLVPATYRGKPGNGAAAILYGAELGLTPIQSLQQIFVVHGAPAIYARTAVALLKSRAGIVVQTIETSDDRVTVSATDPATGQVETSTWDIARATRAGYTSNKKYTTDPQAMLYAKAAMEVCRKIAPDVLLGIPMSREELELEAQPVTVQRARGVAALSQRVAPAPVPAPVPVNAEPEPAMIDPTLLCNQHLLREHVEPADPKALTPAARRKWLAAMFAALGEADCSDRDDQLVVIAALAKLDTQPEHRNGITDEQLRDVVNALNAAKKDGTLGDLVTDILNRAALAAEGVPVDNDETSGE